MDLNTVVDAQKTWLKIKADGMIFNVPRNLTSFVRRSIWTTKVIIFTFAQFPFASKLSLISKWHAISFLPLVILADFNKTKCN